MRLLFILVMLLFSACSEEQQGISCVTDSDCGHGFMCVVGQCQIEVVDVGPRPDTSNYDTGEDIPDASEDTEGEVADILDEGDIGDTLDEIDCENECAPQFQTECVDQTTLKECIPAPNSCLHWAAFQCPRDRLGRNNKCYTADNKGRCCINEACDPAVPDKKCVGNEIKECQTDTLTGCVGWAVLPPQPCEAGKSRVCLGEKEEDYQCVRDKFGLSDSIDFLQLYPFVVPLGTGGFLVAWGAGDTDQSLFVNGVAYKTNNKYFTKRIDWALFDSNGQRIITEQSFYCNNPSGGQLLSLNPLIHRIADRFLISWDASDQQHRNFGICGGVLDSSGAVLKAPFLFNAASTLWNGSANHEVLVPADGSGNFILVWNYNASVYAGVYDSSGLASSVRRVNTSTTGITHYALGAFLDDGRVVITWSGNWSGDADIYARMFDSATLSPYNPQEFLINTYLTGEQSGQYIQKLNDIFIILWHSKEKDHSVGIFAQLYDSEFMTIGSEFGVNSVSESDQAFQLNCVDKDPDYYYSLPLFGEGNYVIPWMSVAQDGNLYGIYAKYFSSDVNITDEIQVNAEGVNSERFPTSVHLDNDTLIVIWQTHDGNNVPSGIWAQQMDSLGNKIGNSLLIEASDLLCRNTYFNLTAAPLTSGGYVVVWQELTDYWGREPMQTYCNNPDSVFPSLSGVSFFGKFSIQGKIIDNIQEGL